MTSVITYGTFDLFHIGHLRLLERARALGDQLLVGVSSDDFNVGKHKDCVHSYDQRAAIVAALKVVDHVFPEERWDQKVDDIQRFGADIFVIGDDWRGEFDFLAPHCRVQYLARTPDVSTTERKEKIDNGDIALADWTDTPSTQT